MIELIGKHGDWRWRIQAPPLCHVPACEHSAAIIIWNVETHAVMSMCANHAMRTMEGKTDDDDTKNG